MNEFLNTYQNIFTALRNPAIGHLLATPANAQEWKQFFGKMENLERAKIVIFKNGRYVLHPEQQAKIAEKANVALEAVTNAPEITPVLVEEAAPVVDIDPLIDCPNCGGKGRIDIDDALGYFGNYLCLKCYGKKKVLKSQSSLEGFHQILGQVKPVAQANEEVSITPSFPAIEPVTELGDGGFAWHDIPSVVSPERLEVLASAVAAPVAEVVAPVSSEGEKSETCPSCGDLGFAFDDASEDPYIRLKPCDCETSEEDELIISDGSCLECLGHGFVNCVRCNGGGIAEYGFPCSCKPEDYTCPVCNGSGEAPKTASQETPVSDDYSPSITETELDALLLDQKRENAIVRLNEEVSRVEAELKIAEISDTARSVRKLIKATPGQKVRVNWTGRGFSCGSFDLIEIVRQYGRTWYVIKTETPFAGLYHAEPMLCELVVS